MIPGVELIWLEPDRVVDGAVELLSPVERARAARLRNPVAAVRFATLHAQLRLLLAVRTGLPADRLPLGLGPFGKPELLDGPHFNLAHAGSFAAVALSWRGPVGIDLERADRVVDPEVVRRLSPAEQEALAGLAPTERGRALLRTWVRKEAVLKASGEGLQRALCDFDVAVEPGSARVLATRPDPRHAAQITLADLEAPGGCVGAVALLSASSEGLRGARARRGAPAPARRGPS